MRGSPTILIDGMDPFAEPSLLPSVSCRLYAVNGKVQGSPSISQLVQAIAGSVDAAEPHPVAVRVNNGELA